MIVGWRRSLKNSLFLSALGFICLLRRESSLEVISDPKMRGKHPAVRVQAYFMLFLIFSSVCDNFIIEKSWEGIKEA